VQLVAIEHVKPGLLVARPMMDSSGRILLREGVELTEAYIGALRAKGYTRLYVKEPGARVDVDFEEDVSPEVRARAFQALDETYRSIEKEVTRLRAQSSRDITDAFASDNIKALLSDKGPLADILDVASQILEEVLSHATLAGLTSIKSANTELFDHAIDVCAVSIMIGRVCGLDHPRLRQLATGALLHDIGKIFLEPHVQGKSLISQHAKLGFELLKNSENADIMAPHVAYEHHEHQDGSGLPRGLRGSNTLKRNRSMPSPVPTLIGEIAAVANIFDNLLTGSDTRPPKPPDEAIKFIRAAAGTALNKEVVTAFIRVVPVYPLGTEVIVRSARCRGFLGVVARINPIALDKPVIVLTHDNTSREIAPIEVDLSTVNDMEIRCKGL